MEILKPKIRFPEFKENWERKYFKDLFTFKSTNSLSREKLNYDIGFVKNIHYGDIHTKFKTLFDIQKEYVPYINEDISLGNVSEENYLKLGDLIIADASEDYNDIGKSIEIINLNNEKVLAGLHTFVARPNNFDIALGFNGYLMMIDKTKTQIKIIAQGTKVLSISTTRLSNILLNIPSKNEQTKITKFLKSVDEKINLLLEKKSLLEEYKTGIMQQIFNQEIRFKDGNKNDFQEWEEFELGEVLDYIQPTKYIVKSTDYNNSFETPVLTAGKTFILGYTDETDNIFSNKLPVIIFDDFTTANKFVDFPFKVKSSAMKILVKKNDNIDIKYIYEFMQTLNFSSGDEHKRYWISEYSKCIIQLPQLEEQIKISNFLSAIDDKIDFVNTQIIETQEYKKGLLQQMFI